MKKIELLAPAGSMEALRAAVSMGADAVYLGGREHNARINAKNFDDEEISKAIKYARLRGKRVYITLNTLLFDDEFESIVSYTNELQDMGANAIIVQDFGVAKALLEQCTIPIHASTQMGIHNSIACKFLEKWGISRAILARETPIEEIVKISKNSNIELEAFIHGALCSSFSGQCVYSFLRGGRSGNRGVCAQPCRLKCRGSKGNYPFSTKDLMSLESLPDLIKAGVSSFKIEGRMKRPEYVGVVTKVYRQALDCIYENRDMERSALKEQLLKIYNRGGFTKGYYYPGEPIYGNKRPNHMGEEIGKVIRVDRTKVIIDAKKPLRVYDGLSFGNTGMEISDLYFGTTRVEEGEGRLSFSSVLKGVEPGDTVFRTTDSKQMLMINEEISKAEFSISISIDCDINKEGINVTFEAQGKTAKVTSNKGCEPAKTRATTFDDVKKAMCKLGDTIFTTTDINIQVADGLFVPIKELNELRRNAIELLEKLLIAGEKREKQPINNVNVQAKDLDIKVAIGLTAKEKPKCDVFLVYPKDGKVENADGVALSPVTFEEDLESVLGYITKDDIVLCNNISQIVYFRDKCHIWAGPGMNCTNIYTRDFLLRLGCEYVISSIEANVPETLIISGGAIPAMTFLRCPMKEDGGCDKCEKSPIRDDKGNILRFNCTRLKNTYAFLLIEYKANFGQVEYI